MSAATPEDSSKQAGSLEPPKLAMVHVNGIRQVFWYRNGEEVFMPPLDLGPDLSENGTE